MLKLPNNQFYNGGKKINRGKKIKRNDVSIVGPSGYEPDALNL